MPVQWDMPQSAAAAWSPQDINQYARLPVYAALQQSKKLPIWDRWTKKYPSLKWQSNQGQLIQGVIAEYSPITKQVVNPANLASSPLVTRPVSFERTNTATIKRQLFQSKPFNFRSSFFDFRTKQIPFAIQDLTRQIGVFNDFFIRAQVLHQARQVYVVGKGLVDVPFGELTTSITPKSAATLANLASQVGSEDSGYLTYRELMNVCDVAQRVIGIPAREGMDGAPADNEISKGKYVLTGERAIYRNLSFDQYVLANRPLSMNLLNSYFSGVIGEETLFSEESKPLIMAADGSFPDAEIEQDVTNSASRMDGLAAGEKEVIPNPDYVNGTFGWAFYEGFPAFETLKVGPPPSDFNNMELSKFAKLSWNGEVRLNKNMLVNFAGTLDTNKWGEWLELLADVTCGILPNTPRYILPVLYRRKNAITS